MTRKHWITKKEIKELYGLSDNKIALMKKLNLVTTKLGVNEGKGRKPLLFKKAMVNALKTHTPKELNELADVVDDTREQFKKQFDALKDSKPTTKRASEYRADFIKNAPKNWADLKHKNDNFRHKNDIEAVVEEDCQKYGFTYEQSVNHPSHYNKTSLEVIDAIDAWDLDFSEGNIVKYLLRAKHKNNAKEDLEKCLWYVQRLLENC